MTPDFRSLPASGSLVTAANGSTFPARFARGARCSANLLEPPPSCGESGLQSNEKWIGAVFLQRLYFVRNQHHREDYRMISCGKNMSTKICLESGNKSSEGCLGWVGPPPQGARDLSAPRHERLFACLGWIVQRAVNDEADRGCGPLGRVEPASEWATSGAGETGDRGLAPAGGSSPAPAR